MAGTGDRQKFGQAFNNTHDKCFDKQRQTYEQFEHVWRFEEVLVEGVSMAAGARLGNEESGRNNE